MRCGAQGQSRASPTRRSPSGIRTEPAREARPWVRSAVADGGTGPTSSSASMQPARLASRRAGSASPCVVVIALRGPVRVASLVEFVGQPPENPSWRARARRCAATPSSRYRRAGSGQPSAEVLAGVARDPAYRGGLGGRARVLATGWRASRGSARPPPGVRPRCAAHDAWIEALDQPGRCQGRPVLSGPSEATSTGRAVMYWPSLLRRRGRRRSQGDSSWPRRGRRSWSAWTEPWSGSNCIHCRRETPRDS